jgi:hypothetical protein
MIGGTQRQRSGSRHRQTVLAILLHDDLRGLRRHEGALVLRATEFLLYRVLLSLVDRATRLPRGATVPEAMRLYRENIALKAQLDALERHLVMLQKGRRKGLARHALASGCAGSSVDGGTGALRRWI